MVSATTTGEHPDFIDFTALDRAHVPDRSRDATCSFSTSPDQGSNYVIIDDDTDENDDTSTSQH